MDWPGLCAFLIILNDCTNWAEQRREIAKIAKYNDAEAERAILRLLLDGGRKKCEADKIGIQPIFKHKEGRIPLYFTSTSCVQEI